MGYAVVLAHKGYFDPELLRTFNHSGSAFGMHLDGNKVTGVDASTGSLGHGLSVAVGLALGAKIQGKSWRTYCIVGDGECNEGSIWEAAMAASHYGLDNLMAFVDRNHLMIDGPTEDVMALEPFEDKWRAFGWSVQTVDGHDLAALSQAIETSQTHEENPTMIICNTVKGKGVDFMENEAGWHYGGLDSNLIARAKASIGGQ